MAFIFKKLQVLQIYTNNLYITMDDHRSPYHCYTSDVQVYPIVAMYITIPTSCCLGWKVGNLGRAGPSQRFGAEKRVKSTPILSSLKEKKDCSIVH